MIIKHDLPNVVMSVSSMAFVLIPLLLGKIFHINMGIPLFTFCTLYAIGPLLGDVYKLYYLTTWWDDLLHFSGGIVFAILGFYLFKFINKNNKTNVLCTALFALFFSITVSCVWEFIEYGVDSVFMTDMQVDTVVTNLNSYYFGDGVGVVGSIEDIESVIVNGQLLEINGYLDIGLHDTMHDMLVETLGGVIICTFYLIMGNKRSMFCFDNMESV